MRTARSWPDPADNPSLVADCVALLTAKRAFVSEEPLKWEPGRPITEWEGVTIGGTPKRVQGLDLGGRGLAGSIPPKLSDLSALRELSLASNRLFGSIPPELGDLRALRSLRLGGNLLTDPIPAELGALASLEVLHLSGNRLSGDIPPTLGAAGRTCCTSI